MNIAQHTTIGLIEETRRHNNGLWMELLRIALEKAPEETRTVLRQINQNDRFIADQMMKLGEIPS